MPTQTKLAHDIQIRWGLRHEVSQCAEIDRAASADPYTEAELVRLGGHRNTILMTAVDSRYPSIVRGFLVYRLSPKHLELIHLAVDPTRHRQGIGGALMDYLKGRLNGWQKRRPKITASVDERNLDAQKFLRATGFVAIEVNHREETIAFVYSNREA